MWKDQKHSETVWDTATEMRTFSGPIKTKCESGRIDKKKRSPYIEALEQDRLFGREDGREQWRVAHVKVTQWQLFVYLNPICWVWYKTRFQQSPPKQKEQEYTYECKVKSDNLKAMKFERHEQIVDCIESLSDLF